MRFRSCERSNFENLGSLKFYVRSCPSAAAFIKYQGVNMSVPIFDISPVCIVLTAPDCGLLRDFNLFLLTAHDE